MKKNVVRMVLTLAAVMLLFTLPLVSLGEAAAPATKEIEISLEGTPEKVLVTQFAQEGQFALWYDATSFAPLPTEKGIRFDLIQNFLSGPVYFSVESFSGTDFDQIKAAYEADGWALEAVDTKELLPLFRRDAADESLQGFFARKGEQRAKVLLVQAQSGPYQCVTEYPEPAAEGWGARMHYLLNTLEALPAV
ncbi:MAG: hypothetical protein PHQ85_08400 [Eubacteriales bacterium]|jgi:hypothetical protein|nr:hypothetical protein [Eubacteriales bacterium]MDD4104885.1 hypothetical protein [Eubacteriales bacterium]MDD4710901.1 hypothetical protein [Eubacteriales bacterium]NLO15368.1 hypothetical protein [Clostridiales bacterium]